jgi:putative ABC transport system permease protein
MTLAVTTAGDPAQLAAPLQRIIASLDARLAAGDVAPMTRVVASVVSPQSATAGSMTVSALIALLLAVAGTYGVLAYSVALRTHEIGVRVALGAGRRDIVRLVLRQASVVVGAGLLLGLVAALAMGRGLRVMLYETSASDPVSLVSAVAVLAGAAAFAAWLPARRAARVDPMVALRAD